MNGTVNDYFVCVFFFAVSVGGLVYLSKCGYNYPSAPKNNEENDPVMNLR